MLKGGLALIWELDMNLVPTLLHTLLLQPCGNIAQWPEQKKLCNELQHSKQELVTINNQKHNLTINWFARLINCLQCSLVIAYAELSTFGSIIVSIMVFSCVTTKNWNYALSLECIHPNIMIFYLLIDMNQIFQMRYFKNFNINLQQNYRPSKFAVENYQDHLVNFS